MSEKLLQINFRRTMEIPSRFFLKEECFYSTLNTYTPFYALKNSSYDKIFKDDKENLKTFPFIEYNKPENNIFKYFNKISQSLFIDNLFLNNEKPNFNIYHCKLKNNNGDYNIINFCGTLFIRNNNTYEISLLGSYVVDSSYIFSKDFLKCELKPQYFKFAIDVDVMNIKVLSAITKKFQQKFLNVLLEQGFEILYVKNLENKIYNNNLEIPQFKTLKEKKEYEKDLIGLLTS